jgi:cell division protease FtsH
MVGRWGMSRAIGPVAVLPRDGARPVPARRESRRRRQKLVDDEVRRIVDERTSRSLDAAREEPGQARLAANALLEHETLDED